MKVTLQRSALAELGKLRAVAVKTASQIVRSFGAYPMHDRVGEAVQWASSILSRSGVAISSFFAARLALSIQTLNASRASGSLSVHFPRFWLDSRECGRVNDTPLNAKSA